MKPQERAKQLSDDHWGYTGKLLELTGVVGCDFALCEYLYKAAATHFYGHAVEDLRNGMFWEEEVAPEYVDSVGMEAELDRSCGDTALDAIHRNQTLRRFQLCPSCARTDCAKGEYPATKDGGCEGYVSALRENMLDAKQVAPLCISCAVHECEAADAWRNICSLYVAKQEAPTAADLPLDFTLPSIALKCTAEEAMAKFESEIAEWKAAKKGSLHEIVERWDCLQALYTFYQRGGDVAAYQCHVRTVMGDLTQYAAEGREVMEARRGMLLKNAKRPNPEGGTGYYSPEVCAAIIASKGHRFQPLDEMGVI